MTVYSLLIIVYSLLIIAYSLLIIVYSLLIIVYSLGKRGLWEEEKICNPEIESLILPSACSSFLHRIIAGIFR
jgi:hypothetical protein